MVEQYMLRVYDVNWVFSDFFFRIDNSFDVNKCLEQIEMPDLLKTRNEEKDKENS